MRCTTAALVASTRGVSIIALLFSLSATPVVAQQANSDVPLIPYESVPNFLKYSPEMNLGETLAVAVNSKGHIMVRTAE